MKRFLRITYFLLFLFTLTNCSRHRTYLLTEIGNIKRTHKNEVNYKRNTLGLYDIDYYLIYQKEITDTNELKSIIDNFIKIIRKRKFLYHDHLYKYSIIMENDSIGHLKMNESSYRDFSTSFEFNLQKKQMHYKTFSGF